MKNWIDHHATLRVLLIALFFVAGFACVLIGAGQSGQMGGLLLMTVGLALLLVALWLYNLAFTEPRNSKP